jgi:hypothetical protein
MRTWARVIEKWLRLLPCGEVVSERMGVALLDLDTAVRTSSSIRTIEHCQGWLIGDRVLRRLHRCEATLLKRAAPLANRSDDAVASLRSLVCPAAGAGP